MTTLFLDFDGVLHPPGTHSSIDYLRTRDARLFIWLPTLSQILAPYPEVQIIVSSDWRTTNDDEDLRQILGPLGPRFAGITDGFSEESRVAEILELVEMRGLTRWVALDDHPSVRVASETDARFLWCSPERGISDPQVQRALQARLSVSAATNGESAPH